MKHLVQFSTGAGSAEVARIVVDQYGADDVTLLTADTMVEDADNWRFASEVWEYLGSPEWVVLADGRTPMQVGRDEGLVPNNRMAVCSRILKRELLRRHIDATYDSTATIVYEGYDWTEPHRFEKAIEPWRPYELRAPLNGPPWLQKADILNLWNERGIKPPDLYGIGMPHANCGGACVRGGQAQWELLLRSRPVTYAEWEAEEEATRAFLGKNVSILRDRRGGKTKPLTLHDFRLRLEAEPALFDHDWGACGCDPMGATS